MNTQELLIHNGGEGQSTEGFHTGIIYSLGIFVLALKLEGEVVGQMSAFVIPS
jgi:hypothetical protein